MANPSLLLSGYVIYGRGVFYLSTLLLPPFPKISCNVGRFVVFGLLVTLVLGLLVAAGVVFLVVLVGLLVVVRTKV